MDYSSHPHPGASFSDDARQHPDLVLKKLHFARHDLCGCPVARMSYKSGVFVRQLAFIALLFVGCGTPKQSDDPRGPETSLYLNDSVLASENSPEVFEAQKTPPTTVDPGSVQLGSVTPGKSIWSIMLETFSNDGHETMAESVCRSLIAELPALGDARVQTTSRGSMIVFGRYESVDDPRGQSDLKKIKELEFHGKKVFRKAILTRVEDPGKQTPITGNDLRALRQRYPKIDPLYTLQVAAYTSSPEKPISIEELKRKAEGHAMMLRTQGQEAYYQVDADRSISVVTIGGFNHTAYDPRSTLYAPEVELLLKKYPKMMVNGEEMLTPIDPKRPKSRKVVMTPKLVEVPR
jgi:hypothetical protein